MTEKSIGNSKGGSLIKLKPSSSLITLKYNGNFCNNLVQKNKIVSIVDDPSSDETKSNLVYDFSKISDPNEGLFNTIIDLLLQLRAAQSDQNVLVQNNTVIREQILNQLKSEILKISNRLTKKEIKDLEVVSSDSFDEKSLTNILKSLLERSKKKLQDSQELDEKFSPVYKRQGRFTDEIFSRYNRIINETSYNQETFDRVLNHISFNKVLRKVQSEVDFESPEKIADSDKKLIKAEKQKKKVLTQKSTKKDIKNLEKINEQHIEDSINKSDLILSVIKSQIKLSETNILSKTKSFVREIISKNVADIIATETELINKSVVKEQVKEIRQDIVRSQEQNDYYRIKHQNEIRRINSELKRFQNLKIISNSKNYISKASEFIDLNTQNIIKKNIIKLSSGKSVLHKFETIGENAINNYISKKAVYKDKFINKLFENYNYDYEKRISRDDINLRHKMINVDERAVRDIHTEDILVNKTNRRYYDRYNEYEDSTNLNEENLNKYRSTKKYLTLKNKKIKKNNIFDEHKNIVGYKNINNIIDRIISTKYQTKLNEFLNFLKTEKINKRKILVESENIDKNLIFDTSQKEILKKIHDRHENIKTKLSTDVIHYDKYLDYINLVNKINTSKIENELHTTQINKKLRNLNNIQIKTSSILNYNKSPESLDFIHRLQKENIIKRDIFIPAENKVKYIDDSLPDIYVDKTHIVHKQLPKKIEKTEEKKSEKKERIKNDLSPDIVFKEKPAPNATQVIDTKKIEEKIMSKTMNKKQIEDLIKSYISKIDIGNISKIVMDGVERKIAMDRRRNGIF